MVRKLCATLTALLSLATFNGALAHGSDNPSQDVRSLQGPYIAIKPPVLLSAGIDVGTYAGESMAYGFTADIDSYVVMATVFAGPYVRFYNGNSFYFQSALGIGSNSRYRKLLSAELHGTIGNEWLFDSGFIIGGEWIGIKMAKSIEGGETFSDKFVIPTLPKLRIGYSW
ncbi:MAG: hypothetical protein FJY29_09705 [Betaproteobacteria bacterium]|nr:hypothetical protein [Betaproteobacteria bacterium]